MTSAHRDSVRLAANVVLELVLSDDGGARVQTVYDHGAGEAPEVLTTLAIPRASLADVAALLLRAAEVAS